jgi:hypothetical protein
MDGNDRINLREHFEKIISLRFDAVEERTDLAFRAQDTALRIAAAELSRRLDGLNHAHEQALEAQRLTVPRETFEATMDSINKRLAAVERLAVGIGAVLAVVSVVLPIAMKFLRP